MQRSDTVVPLLASDRRRLEPQRDPRAAVAEIVRASRAAQGLPPTVTDPSVLARLAVLLQDRGMTS